MPFLSASILVSPLGRTSVALLEAEEETPEDGTFGLTPSPRLPPPPPLRCVAAEGVDLGVVAVVVVADVLVGVGPAGLSREVLSSLRRPFGVIGRAADCCCWGGALSEAVCGGVFMITSPDSSTRECGGFWFVLVVVVPCFITREGGEDEEWVCVDGVVVV